MNGSGNVWRRKETPPLLVIPTALQCGKEHIYWSLVGVQTPLTTYRSLTALYMRSTLLHLCGVRFPYYHRTLCLPVYIRTARMCGETCWSSLEDSG